MLERLVQLAPDADTTDAANGQVRLVRAPGRVNLIGEHTDYNLGFVMPAAIGLETWMASVPSHDSTVRVFSMQADETLEFDLRAIGERRDEWIDYVRGVAKVLTEEDIPLRGVHAVVDSTIPQGAGLSSSAALELAAAWTLVADVPPRMGTMELARAAQRAENEFVGVQSGLMDQFASAHGVPGHALLFDCRSTDYRPLRIPGGYALVAIDTRTPHKLSASQYNSRREQCERGVALIAERHPGVDSLRDVTPTMLEESRELLDEETFRRCRHVVEENARVLEAAAALETGDLRRVGQLFAESHASLRDLYEVTSPELDALVEIATAVPGVVGARMTGGGFGGCTVNLVRDQSIDRLRRAVEREYPLRAGHEAGFYPLDVVGGAGLVAI
jgi:galactokinase